MSKESVISADTIQSAQSSFKSSVRQSSDEYIETMITIPPDGGWGWVVVIGSFFCNFVADGAVYTFGIFLDAIGETFNCGSTTVALANSLMTGFYFVSGPVSCALVNHMGFQVTGFIGGGVAAVAFGTSTLVSSVDSFIIVLGFIGGFGFGLIYVPSVIVIGFYFEKWRALATSIAVTGSAAGIALFPLLIENLFPNYSWQNRFCVISGLCVTASFVALVYRPIKPSRVLTTKDKTVVQIMPTRIEADSIGSFQVDEKPGFCKRLFRRFHNVSYPTQAHLYRESTFLMPFPLGPSTSSLFINSVPEESQSTFIKSATSKTEGRSDRLDKLSTVYEDIVPAKSKCQKCCKKICCQWKWYRWCCGHLAHNRPMYRDDIFFGGSLYTVPMESTLSKPSRVGNLEYTMSVTRAQMKKDGKEEKWRCCPESMLRTLVTMLNFDLVKSPSFICLAFSGFFTILGMYIPFIYLVKRADENNISKDISYYLFTAVGISNAIGRVLSGIISSIPQAKPLIVSYVSLLISGLSTIISYFLIDVYGQFVYVTVFGLTIACLASLRTPIVVELLGLENLTNAFGLLLLAHGIAAFAGVPLGGKIVEMTNSFNASFIFAGAAITVSAVLLMPVKRISDWEKSR